MIENIEITAPNGKTVFVAISPCSWMYPDYGLQVRISLQPNAVNAASVFKCDKSLKWSGDSGEMSRRALAIAEDYLAENSTGEIESVVAKWDAYQEEFRVKQIEERERERSEELDMRRRGFTHKTDLWIHPENGGSDHSVRLYTTGEPTKAQIQKELRGSIVKDDYRTSILPEED